MADYAGEPLLVNDELHWQAAPAETRDATMLRGVADPFSPDGGMRLLTGNLGRAILKTSAVDEDRWTIEAPARSEEHTFELQSRMRSTYAVFSLKTKKRKLI